MVDGLGASKGKKGKMVSLWGVSFFSGFFWLAFVLHVALFEVDCTISTFCSGGYVLLMGVPVCG